MLLTRSLLLAATAALLAPAGARAQALQDGLVAFPNVYKVQFENAYVRLVRIRLPGNGRLGDHTHPPGIMLHVYFTDADPVQFSHDGPPNEVTRPSVQARSYRVGRATPEAHAVHNMGPRLSDYMRVELKTEGDEGYLRRVPAVPLADSTTTIVDVNNSQYRSSRVTIAPGARIELDAPASHPFLLLALTDGIAVEGGGASASARALRTGDEHFVDAAQRVSVRNTGVTAVQLLRVDFLTRPLR